MILPPTGGERQVIKYLCSVFYELIVAIAQYIDEISKALLTQILINLSGVVELIVVPEMIH